MDNEQFKETIYKKYNNYKNIHNDDFFNVHHYRKTSKNIFLNKVAVFFIGIIITVGAVYGGTSIYQYFYQEKAQAKYIENMNDWFKTNDQEIMYKDIVTYEEYLKYKNNWNSIIEMDENEFENNFLIVIVASWRMPGISISQISSDDKTLYIEVDNNITEEEINKEEYMVTAKIPKELYRDNISINMREQKIYSNKYKKLEDLPLDYNIENAKEDGCIIINDLEINEDNQKILNDFIYKTKKENNEYIRIFTQSQIKTDNGSNKNSITITDIEYRDGDYILYIDNRRKEELSDKKLSYIGKFQYIEKYQKDDEVQGYTRIYLRNLMNQKVLIALYK